MRFIIVFGVLLCIVQMVAGVKKVQCIEASYSNGNWTPLAKARITYAVSCGYRMESGKCDIFLGGASQPKEGECNIEDNGSIKCKCASDKCNFDRKNLLRLNVTKEKIVPTWESPIIGPRIPLPRIVFDFIKNRSVRNIKRRSPNEVAPLASKLVKRDLWKYCDTEGILMSMPKYDTLSPPKLMKCHEGSLFENYTWKDYSDLDLKIEQEGCVITLNGEGSGCAIRTSAMSRFPDEESKCFADANKFSCKCNSGEDCHMDIKKAVSEAEKAVKEKQDAHDIVKCMETWYAALPGPFHPPTAAPETTTAAETSPATTSATAPRADATSGAADRAAATSDTGNSSMEWIQVLVISASMIFFHFL